VAEFEKRLAATIGGALDEPVLTGLITVGLAPPRLSRPLAMIRDKKAHE
jgi:hypothetical protein